MLEHRLSLGTRCRFPYNWLPGGRWRHIILDIFAGKIHRCLRTARDSNRKALNRKLFCGRRHGTTNAWLATQSTQGSVHPSEASGRRKPVIDVFM